MSLLYVVSPRKNPQDRDAAAKYYVQSKIRGHRSHRDIVRAAARNTTLSENEVSMAVAAWFDAVLVSLEDGFSVEAADLGTFSVHIKSHGADTESEATATKKISASISYRAKPEIRARVNRFQL